MTFIPRFLSVSFVAVSVLLCACKPSATSVTATPSDSPAAVTAAPVTAPATFEFESWSCPAEPGTAPSGELVAERVTAANSTRTERGLYEGPVWLNGALYFSDFTFTEGFPSRIQRLTADGVLETFVENSGTNGLAIDADGYLLGAAHGNKSISRFHPLTSERSVIIDTFEDNAFNSPNDLTEATDGSLYFTDPDYQRAAAPGGQPKTNVFQITPAGEIRVVDDTIKNPNGISLSPNQDVLYVAGGDFNGVLRAYPIVDGIPGEGKTLVEGIKIPDGMAIDCLGNIYVTEHAAKRVRVFTPEGSEIATINVDTNITNAAFGGPERKTLYLTGAGAVWSIELDVAGFPY